MKINEFRPDWASPPGDTIKDLLIEKQNMSVRDFDQIIGFSPERAKKLLNGDIPITEEIADRLASIFGPSTKFWLNRESQYRKTLARLEATKKLEGEIKKIQSSLTKDSRTKGEDAKLHKMTQRIACFQPSPSKMNALGILKSNAAARIAKHLIEWEQRFV